MISIIISIVSCCIALASIIFTIVKYVSVDKQIANFDTIIKENQVKNLKEEEEQSKRAYVGANDYYHKNDLTKVKFYNRGRAAARNITFEVIDGLQLQIIHAEKLLPYPILNPQESFEISVRCWSDKALCQIKITWEDECGKHEFIQALQLY